MSATFSDAFGVDLSKEPEAERVKAIGETIRLAKRIGMTVRHRPQGWTTVAEDGTTKNWWPAQVNLFADYVHDEATKVLG